MSTPPLPYAPLPPAPYRQSVVVTDIDMTIGAMCRFMVKWAIAAIPALIILWLLLLAAGAVVALLFGGILHGLLWNTPHHY